MWVRNLDKTQWARPQPERLKWLELGKSEDIFASGTGTYTWITERVGSDATVY